MADPEDNSIKVSVRIRPLNSRELTTSNKEGFEYNNECMLEKTASGEKIYRFDHCFPPTSDNSNAYKHVGQTLVLHAMDGYNATIFTYGQTGSGKTHSILGNDADPGFIPRCVEDVFSYKQEHEDTLVFTLRVSYLEVYNEEINDLLTPGEEGQNLKIIAEDPQKGAIIENLVEEVVSEKRDILAVIARGESQRSYGATNMNATSSRSHTLFRLVIESQEILHPINAAHFEDDANPNAFTKLSKETSSTKGAVKVSYLNLVDLAGSERQKSTGAAGSQLKEGSNINKSLLALGAVISKLGESARKKSAAKGSFIPFRDSKLTRILKNSLGGNTLTSILCTVTVAPMHHDETVSTLKFGQLCKTIKNNAKKNEVVDEKTLLRQYRSKISELTQQLATARDPDASLDSAGNSSTRRKSSSVVTEAKLQEILEQGEKDRVRNVELQERLARLQEKIIGKRGSILNTRSGSDLSTLVEDPDADQTSFKEMSRHGSVSRSRTRSASVFVRTDSRELSHLNEDDALFTGDAHHPPKLGVDGKPFEGFDVEVMERQHGAEIERLETLLNIAEERADADQQDIGDLREVQANLRNEILVKGDCVLEMEAELEAAHEKESNSQAYQESMQKEIQEYHERKQEELDQMMVNMTDKKEEMNSQEETNHKRRLKLEEMENKLAVALADLDEKESSLQQQMNQQKQLIRIWNSEKQELITREESWTDWQKDHKQKEWILEEHEKSLFDKEDKVAEREKTLREAEKELKRGQDKLKLDYEDHEHRKLKLEQAEKNHEEANKMVIDWKKKLRIREIDVDERELNADKKLTSIKQQLESIELRDRDVTQLQHELNIREEKLIEVKYKIDQDQKEVERRTPMLDAKQRDLTHRSESLTAESERLAKDLERMKIDKDECEEKMSEYIRRLERLSEREEEVQAAQALLKDVEKGAASLDRRALKQALKEEQWTNDVGMVSARNANALAEMTEHLNEQIKSANKYDEDLKKTRAELAAEKKAKSTAMSHLTELQTKYEKLLKSQSEVGGRHQAPLDRGVKKSEPSFLLHMNERVADTVSKRYGDQSADIASKIQASERVAKEEIPVRDAVIAGLQESWELLDKLFTDDDFNGVVKGGMKGKEREKERMGAGGEQSLDEKLMQRQVKLEEEREKKEEEEKEKSKKDERRERRVGGEKKGGRGVVKVTGRRIVQTPKKGHTVPVLSVDLSLF